MTTNEYILARATQIAELANRATRGTSYSPAMLSVTNEIKETAEGYEIQWMAGIGEFSTYPRKYKSTEEALDALGRVIGKVLDSNKAEE